MNKLTVFAVALFASYATVAQPAVNRVKQLVDVPSVKKSFTSRTNIMCLLWDEFERTTPRPQSNLGLPLVGNPWDQRSHSSVLTGTNCFLDGHDLRYWTNNSPGGVGTSAYLCQQLQTTPTVAGGYITFYDKGGVDDSKGITAALAIGNSTGANWITNTLHVQFTAGYAHLTYFTNAVETELTSWTTFPFTVGVPVYVQVVLEPAIPYIGVFVDNQLITSSTSAVIPYHAGPWCYWELILSTTDSGTQGHYEARWNSVEAYGKTPFVLAKEFGGLGTTNLTSDARSGAKSRLATDADVPAYVANIASLVALTGDATSAVVADTNCGGAFAYTTASPTTNYGTVFAATGKGTGSWVRQFGDTIDLRWFNPSQSPTDSSVIWTNAIAVAKATTKKLFVGTGNYTVTNQLDLSGLTVEGAGCTISNSFAGWSVLAQGTVGGYSALDQSVPRGSDFIVCAALAAGVVAGDLIKLRSSAYFESATQPVCQGEMHRVIAVSTPRVYLDSPTFDTYLTGNTSVVAKVTATTLSLSGITFRGPSRRDAMGVKVSYGIEPTIAGVISDYDICVQLADCWKPTVTASTDNSEFSNWHYAYGVAIINATMYSRVFGGAHERHHHAVMHGADNGAGVPWESVIDSITASQGYEEIALGQPAIDAHNGASGSVEIHNSIIRPQRISIGIGLNARYSRVKNCIVTGGRVGAQVGNAENPSYASSEIDGLIFEKPGAKVETTFLPAAVNVAADTITLTMTDGTWPVLFTTTGTLPAPLATNTLYYAYYASGSAIKLYTTPSCATLVDLLDQGTGTHTMYVSGQTYGVGITKCTAGYVKLQNITSRDTHRVVYVDATAIVTNLVVRGIFGDNSGIIHTASGAWIGTNVLLSDLYCRFPYSTASSQGSITLNSTNSLTLRNVHTVNANQPFYIVGKQWHTVLENCIFDTSRQAATISTADNSILEFRNVKFLNQQAGTYAMSVGNPTNLVVVDDVYLSGSATTLFYSANTIATLRINNPYQVAIGATVTNLVAVPMLTNATILAVSAPPSHAATIGSLALNTGGNPINALYANVSGLTTSWRPVILAARALQEIAATNQSIDAVALQVQLSCDATYTMTGVSQVTAGAQEGQLLFIKSIEASDSVTLQDESVIPGSMLQLGAPSRVIGPTNVLQLMWTAKGATSIWQEVSYR